MATINELRFFGQMQRHCPVKDFLGLGNSQRAIETGCQHIVAMIDYAAVFVDTAVVLVGSELVILTHLCGIRIVSKFQAARVSHASNSSQNGVLADEPVISAL